MGRYKMNTNSSKSTGITWFDSYSKEASNKRAIRDTIGSVDASSSREVCNRRDTSTVRYESSSSDASYS
jgi:hypothetical protein